MKILLTPEEKRLHRLETFRRSNAKRREAQKEYRRIYNEKNKERLAEIWKEYRVTNRTKRIEYAKKYDALHKIEAKFRNTANKATKRSGVFVDPAVIQRVYEDNVKRFGTTTCEYCRAALVFVQATIDHKMPISKGGSHEYCNLAVACKKCNSQKGNKTDVEYLKTLAGAGVGGGIV